LALPPPLPCRTEILLFLEIFFRSLPCQGSSWPAIVGISRFSGRYAEKCTKTKASIVRLGAVRAHSVKIGSHMHCCRTARPIRDLHSLPFHYRSGAMRTELGDQQYLDQETCSSFQRRQSEFVSSGICGLVIVGRVALTLKANGVTWVRRSVMPQVSQGPSGTCLSDPPHRPELLACSNRV